MEIIEAGYPGIRTQILTVALSSMALVCATSAHAGPVYQPQGANLTLGDVTHGKRVQSASSNPAAAAADLARASGKATRGTVVSVAAGLEYGNIQNLFDFYDSVTGAYEPSDPGTGGGPSQLPETKPGGIDLGEIWDNLDPDAQEAARVIVTEVARQVVLAALISEEGHAKAWVAVDAPFVIDNEYLGGAWTFGVNWSGSSKAYGLVQPIDFDEDAARQALQDWFDTLPINRPTQLPLGGSIDLMVDPVTNGVLLSIDNDSSIITKATQTTELNFGYSREAWRGSAGNLYMGA